MPVSTRSSTDDFELSKRTNDFKPGEDGLELFFGGKINLDNYKFNESEFEVKSGISNFEMIDPLKGITNFVDYF